MSYQTGTWLPWWIKRYILRNKSAQLKPLYTFDDHVMADSKERKASMAHAGHDDSGSGSDTKV